MSPADSADALATQFVAALNAELDRRKMTIKDFAELVGVGRTAVSEVLNLRAKSIRSSTMSSWLIALDLEPQLVVKKKDA